MTDDDIVLVRERDTDAFGLYHPDEDIIETYIGDDRHDIPGAYKDHNWYEAETDDLHASIEAQIESLESDIEDLRDRELTDDQEQELDRLEWQLESHRNLFQTLKEVAADGD